MSIVGEEVPGNREMLVTGEDPKVPTPEANPSEPQLTEARHRQASQILLKRILELHSAGFASEEIAAQVLTAEPDNAAFRAAMLVEIILDYARPWAKENSH